MLYPTGCPKKEDGLMKRLVALLICAAVLNGCAAPSIKLISDAADPLREFTLEGTTAEKS